MAKAEQVKAKTGYSIGGVPPFGHIEKIDTYYLDGFQMDQELVAAGGAHNAVFKITFDYLLHLTSATRLEI